MYLHNQLQKNNKIKTMFMDETLLELSTYNTVAFWVSNTILYVNELTKEKSNELCTLDTRLNAKITM